MELEAWGDSELRRGVAAARREVKRKHSACTKSANAKTLAPTKSRRLVTTPLTPTTLGAAHGQGKLVLGTDCSGIESVSAALTQMGGVLLPCLCV